MNTVAKEQEVSKKAPWQTEGLPGKPVVEKSFNNYKEVPLGDLVRDTAGKVITAHIWGDAEKLISSFIGKTVKPVKLLLPVEGVAGDHFADVVAFQYTGSGNLSWLDRHAAATLAWLSSRYYPPTERHEKIVFPSFLDGLPAEPRSSRPHTLSRKAFTEAKAIQVASVLETLYGVKASVFEDGNRWFVTIDEDQYGGFSESTFQFEQIDAILFLLSDFDVVPVPEGERMVFYDSDRFHEPPLTQEYLDAKAEKARAAQIAYQRIEEKLDAVLARLNTAPDNAPPEAARDHIRPTGKGKKTATA